jgi:CRP/FNR family cyclic AMP-dependent transcriptional regulator
MRRVLFILGQLTDQDSMWIANNGEKITYPKGSSLINAGQASNYLFIILDGSAAVQTARGKFLAKVHSGDILGEMSFIDSTPPIASVIANSECKVLCIKKSLIKAKLKADEGFSARFYKALAMFLADRMRNTILSMGFDVNADNEIEEDELDEDVLDNVHLAGIRFEKMLQILNH